jgi:hypothetical protein
MIKIDFYSDWIEYLKACLQEFGYPVDTLYDPVQISISYFNAIKRRIPVRTRKIFKSDVFSCPNDLEDGLRLLENKVQTGQDINPNLSRGLQRVGYNDYLLNDWGIYHFHLGREIENDGYIKRTDPVLFGFISHDSFYEINIYSHGNWSNLDLIEVVHRNWPYLLEKFRLNDVVQMPYTPDSSTIKEFRNNQINSFVQVEDGTVYSQPGLGYATDGTAVDVSVATIRYKKFMEHLQKTVTEDLADEIEKEVVKLGHTSGEDIELKLSIENGWAYAFCEQYNIKFKLHSMNIA